MIKLLWCVAAVLSVSGCATMAQNWPKKYVTEVVSSPPGADIEVDGVYRGKTPIVIEWRGNPDRVFNDGYHVVKAYLNQPGCCPQLKLYSGGAEYAANDVIPRLIYFDMRSCAELPASADVNYSR